MNTRLLAKASIIALAAGIALPQAASAQGAVGALRDEILVTATKKADAENVQDVPLAITAYGAEQLDALKVRTLESLTTSVPNVSLDDIGTSRGVANFSIRGLGINSSIPSIDPTVGVFVDGVYLGINGGVVLDIFDLESIEVLRGPQGILFGRNVTGGAVLINTKRPSDEFEVSFKSAVESGLRGTGLNYFTMGSVSVPLGDVLAAKVAVYYNDDNGWHENFQGGPNLEAILDGVGGTLSFLDSLGFPIATNKPDGFKDFGEAQTFLIRPSIYFTPTDGFELIARYEHGDSDGDGPASQNHTNGLGQTNPLFSASRNGFDFSIDEPGFYESEWDQVTVEASLDVGFGDGTITNIFGWRDFTAETQSDIDATPFFLFHAGSTTDQDQISNETRYNGRFFDRLDVTTGFYYFTQDIAYNERRALLGGFRFLNGGGVQDQRTWAIFSQFDFDLTETFTFTFGARYTNEKKEVVISNLLLNTTLCDVRIPGSCSEDFVDEETWKNFTPKIGFEWAATDFVNFYGHWTQGVRSGGYNFRNTAGNSIPFVPNPAPPPAFVPNPGFNPLFLPGPFDEETVNAFEVGFKAQPGDGRATINAAFYLNDIDDMQRELNLADPVSGVVQVITNTADATIFGFEIEAQYAATDNLLLLGSVGHANGDYDSVKFDLNGDGVLSPADEALKIPRLVPWTWSAGFVHNLPLGGAMSVDTRFNYSHRDSAFYTDNNLGFLNELEIIDASVALNLTDGASLSVYGKNLLNENNFGGDTQLPLSLGAGTFSPLSKGRIVGLELQLDL